MGVSAASLKTFFTSEWRIQSWLGSPSRFGLPRRAMYPGETWPCSSTSPTARLALCR
jgi:hypothetical protein